MSRQLRRRQFLICASALLVAPRAVFSSDPPVVGVLMLTNPKELAFAVEWLRTGLQRLGYEDRKNITLDIRYADGDEKRFPSIAREMLFRKPKAIYSACGPGLRAIRDVSRTVPVISDCAEWRNYHGEVQSIGRPGGATTGFVMLSPESVGKRLEFLKEIHHGLKRVGVLHNRTDTWQDYWSETERAAQALGLELLRLPPIQLARELEEALAQAVAQRADALVVFPSGTTMGLANQIAAFAIEYRLLTAFDVGTFVRSGGLLSYGPNFQELFGDVLPRYIDRILRGASPADLPIVQPTMFNLVVNLKTAKAIGVTVPRSILLRADQVIE